MISINKWFEIESQVINQVNTLDFSNKNITEIPSLVKYTKLKRLICRNNKLTKIPELPENLKYLDVRNNKIEHIPYLPPSLKIFDCANNRITKIPEYLPPNLKIFICNNNKIKKVPPLNDTKLIRFECMKNNIHYLNNLPSSLIVLNYDELQMRDYPEFIGHMQEKIWINGFRIIIDECKMYNNEYIGYDDIDICFSSEESEYSF